MHVKQLAADPEIIVMDDWANATRPLGKYRKGPPGVRLMRLAPSPIILYLVYDSRFNLIAMGRYYELDWPIQKHKAGDLHLWVHPQLKGRGVGTAVLKEVMTYWDIDFSKQQYSGEGLAFTRKFLAANP